jgi:predicted secreted hydrolase
VEWWYYTGHLRNEGGQEFGFQLTFFRVHELHLAHFAWTDIAKGSFRYEEKVHLALPGIASTETGRLNVSNEDWWASESRGVQRLRARGNDVELDLTLLPSKPPVLHGAGGISLKGPGPEEYSHYVSITRLTATGTMRKQTLTYSVTGTAWFDHEWGPGVLPEGAAGWDWFAIQLDDGSDLMLYRMRSPDGSATSFSGGTFVPDNGAPRAIRWPDVRLQETRVWSSPRTHARYPAGWQIAVGSLSLELTVEPVLPDQELVTEKSTGVTYWEGSCRVRGRRAGRPVTGQAYAELTGYAGRDVPGFGR